MEPLDIFIGGGADDLMPGGGVLRTYARDYAAATGREVRYLPNARVGRAKRLMRAAAASGRAVRIVGHSWGAPDAYRAVATLVAEGLPVDLLVTLDPIDGPQYDAWAAFTAPWLRFNYMGIIVGPRA